MKKLLALAFASLISTASYAAPYPDHAIKLIVPWAAGGDTDLIFRPLLPLLQKYLGQPIIIANVGGASGTVGEREAADATPDGYTIFGAHDYIHSVYFGGIIDIKYSDAFVPVCLIASTPSVITVGEKTPWKIVQGAGGRRQEAARPDRGRRFARFDQPVFDRARGQSGRHHVQIRAL